MENFYDLLKITNNASNSEVLEAYKKSIKRFTNLKQLSKEQINEIRNLKTALYVLSNDDLRTKYYNMLSKIDNVEPYQMKSDELIATTIYDNIDSQFNTLNINNNNVVINNNSKKNKILNDVIGNRIFSLSEFNKKPLYPVEYKINNQM
jgi:DnaJ-class molecular chaperone